METGAAERTILPATSRKDVKRAMSVLSSSGIAEIAKQQKDEPGSIRILEEGGEPLGALAHRRETWEVGAANLKVARLWEVTGEFGEASFRRTGDRRLFDALVSDWRAHLKQAGYHLAYAHGELALWPVHGFFPCFYHPRVYVPTVKAMKLKNHYKVRSVKSSDAKPMLAMMRKNAHLRPRVFATGVPNFHHFAVEGPNREVFGYFSLSVSEGNGRPPVFIPEVEVMNREAAETVLAHAAPFARENDMRAIHFALAAEHPFASACLDLGGHHQLMGTTRDITLDEEMVHVVDVVGCLTAIREDLSARRRAAALKKEPAAVVLEVDGEWATLVFKDDGIEVEAGRGPGPVASIPRWAFTQLFMGYRTASELRAKAIRPDASRPILDVLFPKLWPFSLCDHDLWDPTLRDPEKYCDKALQIIRALRYPF